MKESGSIPRLMLVGLKTPSRCGVAAVVDQRGQDAGVVGADDQDSAVDFAVGVEAAPADVMAITTTVIERGARGLPYYGRIELRLRESRCRDDLAFLYKTRAA